MPMPIKNMTGERFGRLIVQHPTEERGSKGEVKWHCICDCGNNIVASRKHLIGGGVRSCGCLGLETKSNQGKKAKRHGLSGTKTHRAWSSMRQRCKPFDKNTRAESYKRRGITVCERWASFDNFLSDMGEAPPGSSLDRIDNNKGYEPGNCRWTTAKIQANNRSTNVLLSLNGQTMTVMQWAENLGVRFGLLSSRIRRGWPISRALTTPPISKRTPRGKQ